MHRPDRHWQDALGPRQADDGHARPVRPRQGGLLCADVCQPDAGPARREARQAAQGHLRAAARQEVHRLRRRRQHAAARGVRRAAAHRDPPLLARPRRLVRPQDAGVPQHHRHLVRGRDGPAGRRPADRYQPLPSLLYLFVLPGARGLIDDADLRRHPQHVHRGLPPARRRQLCEPADRRVARPVQHAAQGAAADARQVALHVQPARPLKGLPGHDAGHAQVGRRAKGPDLPLVPRDAAGFL
mmetsp:Transcript_69178/g.207489  ORF Transcript_69178/g.207489 Transcript_69178/m.207489 type:complete len:242 (+) Transcript_69178:284-1009(+)